MASTYNSLGIQLMATGENAGTWGTNTNNNLNFIMNTLGYIDVALTADRTLTIPDGSTGTYDGRAMWVNLSGTTGGSRVLDKAAQAGDEDLLSAVGYAIQDVINVRSAGRNKTQYLKADASAIRFMKAIRDFRSRAHSAGVPNIDMRALNTALLDKAHKDGINIKQVEENSKILLYAARNVEDFASRIFDLRLTVN